MCLALTISAAARDSDKQWLRCWNQSSLRRYWDNPGGEWEHWQAMLGALLHNFPHLIPNALTWQLLLAIDLHIFKFYEQHAQKRKTPKSVFCWKSSLKQQLIILGGQSIKVSTVIDVCHWIFLLNFAPLLLKVAFQVWSKSEDSLL